MHRRLTAPQVHNVILIALSAWMAGSAVYWAFQYGYHFWGNGFKASETELGMTIYVFYLSKFYEFFDTVGCRRALLLGSIVTHAHILISMVCCPAVHHVAQGQVRADIAVTRVPSCLHIVHMVRFLPCVRSFEPCVPIWLPVQLLTSWSVFAGGQLHTLRLAVTVRTPDGFCSQAFADHCGLGILRCAAERWLRVCAQRTIRAR